MSIIDEGLVVSGDIFGEDNLTVKGVVKGSIFLKDGNVSIEESGYVEGEILANNVTISGEISGNVTAITRLQVMSTSKIFGNIQSAKIAMAEGAFLSGKMDIREPEPVESEIQDFQTLSEEDYEKLRRWRIRNNIE
jgi:cytoskeletal protein CcmA (bactofilin family)